MDTAQLQAFRDWTGCVVAERIIQADAVYCFVSRERSAFQSNIPAVRSADCGDVVVSPLSRLSACRGFTDIKMAESAISI